MWIEKQNWKKIHNITVVYFYCFMAIIVNNFIKIIKLMPFSLSQIGIFIVMYSILPSHKENAPI